MRQRCAVSSIHTLRPTSVFVRIFIDIMHSPALYPNLSIWPPNPDLKSILTHLKTTPFEVMRTSQIVPTFQKCPHIACGMHITSKVKEQTHLLCAHGYTAQCVVLCSWAVWGQRGPCYTVLVLERQDGCCRWTGELRATPKNRFYAGPSLLWTIMEVFSVCEQRWPNLGHNSLQELK